MGNIRYGQRQIISKSTIIIDRLDLQLLCVPVITIKIFIQITRKIGFFVVFFPLMSHGNNIFVEKKK